MDCCKNLGAERSLLLSWNMKLVQVEHSEVKEVISDVFGDDFNVSATTKSVFKIMLSFCNCWSALYFLQILMSWQPVLLIGTLQLIAVWPTVNMAGLGALDQPPINSSVLVSFSFFKLVRIAVWCLP